MVSTPFTFDRIGCESTLRQRLGEPPPTRIQVLSGPRQVGKTTLLTGLAEELGPAALYVAADGPEAALPGFWERLWARAEEVSRGQGRAVLLLDELPLLPDWAGRLKGEWDRITRAKLPIHVVASGSLALSLDVGSRESLAGRFERLVLTHWSAASLAAAFGLSPDEAADLVVQRGAYPGAMPLRQDLARWTAYIRDAIVEPAIGRDLLALAPVRRPAMLRQVFALSASSPAQILSLQKLQGQLQDPGALETIAHYLDLLRDAYLVAPLQKYSERPLRRRSAPPKLVTLNNALLCAVDPRPPPDAATDPARFGAWVENACLAHAVNSGQEVAYWRDANLEVGAVVQGPWGPWAIEVKTGPFATHELRGLAELTRRHPALRPLVVCDERGLIAADRLGLPALHWRRFLHVGDDGPASLLGSSGLRPTRTP